MIILFWVLVCVIVLSFVLGLKLKASKIDNFVLENLNVSMAQISQIDYIDTCNNKKRNHRYKKNFHVEESVEEMSDYPF